MFPTNIPSKKPEKRKENVVNGEKVPDDTSSEISLHLEQNQRTVLTQERPSGCFQ